MKTIPYQVALTYIAKIWEYLPPTPPPPPWDMTDTSDKWCDKWRDNLRSDRRVIAIELNTTVRRNY